jgi:hypothetical protein
VATKREVDENNSKIRFAMAASPVFWLEYSEDLMEASEALWLHTGDGLSLEVTSQNGELRQPKQQMAHTRSYTLLAGFFLENVLKGIRIATDPSLVSAGALAKELTRHNLLTLTDSIAGISTSQDERQILQSCQEAIPYWGRYPIPLKHEDLTEDGTVDSKFRKSFVKLHFRLCHYLYNLIKDGWDSGIGAQTLSMRSVRYGDAIDLKTPLPWLEEEDSP